MAKRTSYRVRLVKATGPDTYLWIEASRTRAYEQARAWTPTPYDQYTRATVAVQVQVRAAGSDVWELLEETWRRAVRDA